MSQDLTLNVVPLDLEGELLAGRIEWNGDEAYAALRDGHRSTHVFRYDSSARTIYSVSLVEGVAPLGDVSPEDPSDHLLLLGKAFQTLVLRFLAGRFDVLRPARPLEFWGGKKDSRLLSNAISAAGQTAKEGVEVFLKYSLDTRVITLPDEAGPRLCLVLDTGTSNQLDLPVSTLVADGFPLVGKSISLRREFDGDSEHGLLPRLDWVGTATSLDGDAVTLAGSDLTSADASLALLEPHYRNLRSVLEHYYPGRATRILSALDGIRGEHASASGKLKTIEDTLRTLREHASFELHGGLSMHVSSPLVRRSGTFPESMSVDRPGLLFGAQGRDTHEQPDAGIQRWGPYRYSFHERNEVTIGVICEAEFRGRTEQFMQNLRDGWPDHHAGARNPYSGGLVGKFRLSSVRVIYETAADPGPDSYRAAIRRLLDRDKIDLAYVQTRDSHHQLFGDENSYLVAKADLMLAGIPVQGIKIETIDTRRGSLPYILNNIALASYAKLGGTPWLMAVRNPTAQEVVIGLGYTETGHRSVGGKKRFVGITSLFSGDGRYLLWGRSREVEFDGYAEALLETLRATIDHVRRQNHWQDGDHVRLVFHVYKHLKHSEIASIKALVKDLVGQTYVVEYAFLDVSSWHHYNLFDPAEAGAGSSPGRRKGQGVPSRGTCIRLGEREALLHLTGPRDLKTAHQGLPQPLLLNLHQASDFDDLTYLTRQVYHFSYMSWRSFFPATEPVTVYYSRLLARKLASLRSVSGWSPLTISQGALRESMWFL